MENSEFGIRRAVEEKKKKKGPDTEQIAEQEQSK